MLLPSLSACGETRGMPGYLSWARHESTPYSPWCSPGLRLSCSDMVGQIEQGTGGVSQHASDLRTASTSDVARTSSGPPMMWFIA